MRTSPLSSPRRRGPIATERSMFHLSRHNMRTRRMGPRFRGDDSWRVIASLVLAAMCVLTASTASAADRIRVAVQRTGTLAWELDIIKAHGLDRKANLEIQAIELATPEAGKIAIKGGSADLLLSDWLWVTRERALGDNLVFYPSSSTVGAVMVPANSSIRSVADLRGKKIAVAGGPLDKSWLLLQGLARRSRSLASPSKAAGRPRTSRRSIASSRQ